MTSVNLKPYGSLDIESISKDLGKKEGIFENIIEPFHNSESNKSTKFEIDLCEFSIKNKKHPDFYLRCLDNGIGMDELQTNNFSSLNKDIYNKRIPGDPNRIRTNTTHSFGGRGSKDFMAAVYEGVVYIFTSPPNSKKLILIAFNTKLSWGEDSKNPNIFKIDDYDNIMDEEYSNISAVQERCIDYNEKSIKKIIAKSGFLIFGKIKKKFIPYFKTEQNKLEEQFKKYCNKNLKNCKVIINNSELNYIIPKYKQKYTIKTVMSLWKSSKTEKYILTFNYNGNEMYLMKKKGKSYIQTFDDKKYDKLTSFNRIDQFNYKCLEDKFYNILYENNKRNENRNKDLVSTINYERLGTILFAQHQRSRKSSGDMWIRDVLCYFKTTYIWGDNEYMDKIFQINADKLNPNITKVKEFLTSDSYYLLTNNRINEQFIKHNKFKLFKCYKYLLSINNLDNEDKYTFINDNYKYLKDEMIHSNKLEKWLIQVNKKVNKKNLKTRKNLIKVFDTAVVTAQKCAEHCKLVVVELDKYLQYKHFKRDHILDETMLLIKNIKKFINSIVKEFGTKDNPLDNIEYSKKLNCTTFYYILHNEHKNDRIIFEKVKIESETESASAKYELMYCGEIGVTNNTVKRRHPGSNVQFQIPINEKGSKTTSWRSKRVCEKLVIDKLAKIDGIIFGTKKHPKSKETFRFPISKRSDVFKKIITEIMPYIEEEDIFSKNIY